jgi:hypothetical protein
MVRCCKGFQTELEPFILKCDISPGPDTTSACASASLSDFSGCDPIQQIGPPWPAHCLYL